MNDNILLNKFAEFISHDTKLAHLPYEEHDDTGCYVFALPLKDWLCPTHIVFSNNGYVEIDIELRKVEQGEVFPSLWKSINQLNIMNRIGVFILINAAVHYCYRIYPENEEFLPSEIFYVLEVISRFIIDIGYGIIVEGVYRSKDEKEKEEKQQSEVIKYKRKCAELEYLQKSSMEEQEEEPYYYDNDSWDDEHESKASRYNELLERHNYDEDSLESDPDYWDYMYDLYNTEE